MDWPSNMKMPLCRCIPYQVGSAPMHANKWHLSQSHITRIATSRATTLRDERCVALREGRTSHCPTGLPRRAV